MTKPIQIKKEDIVRDIRELAALSGRPITEVVGDAVRSKLDQARRRAGAAQREKAIDRILEEYRRLPKTGRMLTDDDLYDENGLPK